MIRHEAMPGYGKISQHRRDERLIEWAFDEAFRSVVDHIGKHVKRKPFPLEPNRCYVLLEAEYWQTLVEAASC